MRGLFGKILPVGVFFPLLVCFQGKFVMGIESDRNLVKSVAFIHIFHPTKIFPPNLTMLVDAGRI